MLTLFNWIGVRWGLRHAWTVVAIVVPVLALLVGLIAGALVARHYTQAPLRAQLAELRQANAQAQTKALQDQALRVQAAQARTDRLAEQLAGVLKVNDQLTQEKTDALKSATAGRACLSDRALRVLNGSTGIRVAGLDGMPPTGPRADAASAPTATDPDTAGLIVTDTGIATWTITAGQQHEACRLRLDALIDWHEAQPSPAGGTVER
jgi:uncharacterized membrane-anchored protein YhcB (DUF1043 family)